jgi:hypothetical protein
VELLEPAQNGFSSLLAAEFLLRVTDSARTLPEELVNPASTVCLAVRLPRGQANQPDLTFPQLPGIILETVGHSLTSATDYFS